MNTTDYLLLITTINRVGEKEMSSSLAGAVNLFLRAQNVSLNAAAIYSKLQSYTGRTYGNRINNPIKLLEEAAAGIFFDLPRKGMRRYKIQYNSHGAR